MTFPSLHPLHDGLAGQEHQFSRRRFEGALRGRLDQAPTYGRAPEEAERAGRPAKGDKRLFGKLAVCEGRQHRAIRGCQPLVLHQPGNGQIEHEPLIVADGEILRSQFPRLWKVRVAVGEHAGTYPVESVEVVHG